MQGARYDITVPQSGRRAEEEAAYGRAVRVIDLMSARFQRRDARDIVAFDIADVF